MNERIRQLAEQATKIVETTDHCSGASESHTEVDLEKFAELIVQECCQALSPMLRDMISRGHGYELIKQHFGVEE